MTDYSSQEGQNNVMVGCGCKTVKDVVTFIRERRIDYVELAWADEMGLWHHERVPISELTYASFQEGTPTKDGRLVLPDPVSARIAPLTSPNTMLFTCNPPTRSSFKTKQISPELIEMISKKIKENDKCASNVPIDRVLDSKSVDKYGGPMGYPSSPYASYTTPRTPQSPNGFRNLPTSPVGSPSSPGSTSSGFSSSGSIGRSPSPNYSNLPGIASLPGISRIGSPGSPGLNSSGDSLNSSGGFIEWRLIRNDSPRSPNSDGSGTPPGSVPGSPSLASPRSPQSLVPDVQEQAPPAKVGRHAHHVPPLLRPRQIHPTKATKLGIVKPTKKRRNTENLYCRHCGTTETPEWRRGPDGRKSLCNACGLYYSKMIKRETMVVPQGRRVAIDALLNPHS